jgi:hypothetical protein
MAAQHLRYYALFTAQEKEREMNVKEVKLFVIKIFFIFNSIFILFYDCIKHLRNINCKLIDLFIYAIFAYINDDDVLEQGDLCAHFKLNVK